MSKEERKVPELRFKGFHDDWEQRQVLDLSKETFGGGTPKTSKKDYWSGDIPWIQSSDLKEHDVKNIRVRKQITKTGLENSAAKLIPKNSLAIVTRVGVGKVVLVPFDYATSQDFLSLSNLNINNYFGLFLMYHKLQKELLTLQGTSIKGITKREILKKRLRVPKSPQEQEAIGRLVNELDRAITLHQRRINIWESLKKEYINVILPSKKHDTFKLRFNDYEKIWKNHKIKKLANRFDNLRIPVSSSDRVPGETPYYGANGIQDYVEGHTHNGEFILIAEDGANSLKNYPVHYVDGKVWVNNHAHVLQGINGIADNRFLMYTFKSINFAPYLVGGSRFKLNADTMMKINIKVPTLNEQKKIGKYFSLIDGYINISHKKIHHLQEIKKIYLRKMFL